MQFCAWVVLSSILMFAFMMLLSIKRTHVSSYLDGVSLVTDFEIGMFIAFIVHEIY